ncbi:MAG: CAP domain-containing protein [Crocinitomicaceae bacterium]
MIKVVLIYGQLLISIFVFGQTEVVDLSNFNANKLNHLIIEYTNQLRSKKRRPPLAHHALLDNAAQNHADYMADRKRLSHTQRNRNLKTVKDRVEALGGNADFIGENIQFISINYEIEQSNYQLTYIQLAKILGDNWKASKGHYLNMIDREYSRVSHQFAFANGLLFVCQVFSS